MRELEFSEDFHVLKDANFQVVLGLNFLLQHCDGFLLREPCLIIDGEKFPCKIVDAKSLTFNFLSSACNFIRHESYRLTNELREEGLTKLIGEKRPEIDLFSVPANATEKLYITQKMNSWSYSWQSLYEEQGLLWANPPFSKLPYVVVKAASENLQMVLVVPEWRGPKQMGWQKLLDRISCRRVLIDADSEGVIYQTNDGRSLPRPKWETYIPRGQVRVDP